MQNSRHKGYEMITKIESEYEKAAREFLESHGITFTAVLIGSDCPRFCEDAAKGVDMDKVSTFPRKTHIHGKHYRCTFSRVKPGTENYNQFSRDAARLKLDIDFWNSYADEEFNAWRSASVVNSENVYWDKFKGKRGTPKRTPTAYDVITSMERSEPASTFEDWCSEFGYDSDSRKAHATYEAVQAGYTRVKGFFTLEELVAMWEIN